MQKKSSNIIYKHRDLVEACARNDRRAQIKIYDLYYKAMYNVSLHIVKDSYIAEDIMQDSFIDAFSKLETFEWRSSFGSWLKRIVINKSLDIIKQKQDNISLSDEFIETKEDIIEDFDQVECRVEEIKEKIKALPQNYRLVLVLYLIEGYDHQEISEILKIPYNNVRVRYMRAKRKLLETIIKSRSNHVLN